MKAPILYKVFVSMFPIVLISFIVVLSCKKETKSKETREQALLRLSATLSANEIFKKIISNHVEINMTAHRTAKPNSFFNAQEPLLHPFHQQLSLVPLNDTQQMKKLYLSQFSAGDTMVDLIYELSRLGKEIARELPELTALSSSDLKTVLESSTRQVSVSSNSVESLGCRVVFYAKKSGCKISEAIRVANCVGIFDPTAPSYDECLAREKPATDECISEAREDYADCDPGDPSPPK